MLLGRSLKRALLVSLVGSVPLQGMWVCEIFLGRYKQLLDWLSPRDPREAREYLRNEIKMLIKKDDLKGAQEFIQKHIGVFGTGIKDNRLLKDLHYIPHNTYSEEMAQLFLSHGVTPSRALYAIMRDTKLVNEFENTLILYEDNLRYRLLFSCYRFTDTLQHNKRLIPLCCIKFRYQ